MKKKDVEEKTREWEKTTVDLTSVDWRGNPIHLKNVPAIKNPDTGKVRVYPSDVSEAEIEALAEKHNIRPRDVPTLLTILAKPGHFQEGQLHHKYRLNKTLFYLWKELEHEGLGSAFPHDEFVKAPRGPVPKNLEDDLKRLEDSGIVTITFKNWGEGPESRKSAVIALTNSGTQLAKEIWSEVAEPFKTATQKVKERYFPLDQKTIRDRVHQEYPEYKETYTELDTD
jgi:hypothetical protein